MTSRKIITLGQYIAICTLMFGWGVFSGVMMTIQVIR